MKPSLSGRKWASGTRRKEKGNTGCADAVPQTEYPSILGKGRAVCIERCTHGSREGGTGDPARDDRPLLYNCIGSHARKLLPGFALGEQRRPVRLQVGWEKDGEGNPADPSQARLQTSRHAK